MIEQICWKDLKETIQSETSATRKALSRHSFHGQAVQLLKWPGVELRVTFHWGKTTYKVEKYVERSRKNNLNDFKVIQIQSDVFSGTSTNSASRSFLLEGEATICNGMFADQEEPATTANRGKSAWFHSTQCALWPNTCKTPVAESKARRAIDAIIMSLPLTVECSFVLVCTTCAFETVEWILPCRKVQLPWATLLRISSCWIGEAAGCESSKPATILATRHPFTGFVDPRISEPATSWKSNIKWPWPVYQTEKCCHTREQSSSNQIEAQTPESRREATSGAKGWCALNKLRNWESVEFSWALFSNLLSNPPMRWRTEVAHNASW